MDVADRRRRGIELQRGHGASPPGSRLTVLSSFNLDLIPPFLAEALDRRGLAAQVVTGDFGQIAAGANPASSCTQGDPGDVLMVPAVEDPLVGPYDGDAPPDVARAGRRPPEELSGRGVRRARAAARRHLLRRRLRQPPRADAHVLDPGDPRRGQARSSASSTACATWRGCRRASWWSTGTGTSGRPAAPR